MNYPLKKALLFILMAALLPLAVPCSALSSDLASQYPTREEEYILMLNHQLGSYEQALGATYLSDANARKVMNEQTTSLTRYARSACKKKMAGDWYFFGLNDAVNIDYDDKNMVFIGRVTRVVKFDKNWVKPGYVLFKVYFPKDYVYPPMTKLLSLLKMDLAYLRANYRDKCKFTAYSGTEYSFKFQGNKMVPASSPISISIKGEDDLLYQLGSENYSLIRKR